MKKTISLSFSSFEIDFEIKHLILVAVFFISGVVFSSSNLFVSNNTDIIFSPFSFYTTETNLVQILVHYILTYCIYALAGVLFSTSFLGFIAMMPLVFVFGGSLAYSVSYLFQSNQIIFCLVACLPFWAIFSAVMLYCFTNYFKQSFARFSYAFVKHKTFIEDGDALRPILFQLVFSVVAALVTSFVHFAFLAFI